jgi:hydroxyacid-oxoacid transhydrogenase
MRLRVKCFSPPLLRVLGLEMPVCTYAMVGPAYLSFYFDPLLTVHLGMSYPISGQNPGYKHAGYEVNTPIIPHGVSVAVSAPAVFRFTGPSNPERHLAAAEAFGVDISNVKNESAGAVLAEAIEKFLADLGDQPRGLKDLGFKRENLDDLVEGTIPQARVLMLAPGLAEEVNEEREQLKALFEDAMEH